VTEGDGAPLVSVVAVVLEDHGRICITRRPEGTHLAGYWEFPGGKVEPGEEPVQALIRELREELAVEIAVGPLLHRSRFTYPDRKVELSFYAGRALGVATPQQGQELRWVARQELTALRFPPADEELIQKLANQPAR
tara:strand:- start:11 stop:421 length:411 start_codon:yes stop_codon:yes gene_type:complete